MKTTQVKFQLGKNKLTDNFIDSIVSAFKNRRQVRISVLHSATRDKDEIKKIAEEIQDKIAFKTDSRIIGFTIILIKTAKKSKS